MIEVLPAILAHDEKEFIAKVDRVRQLGAMLHIDVMDGKFVNNTTWAPVDRVGKILDYLPYEVHLMVAEPEHAAPTWVAAGATRVIFHVEATTRESLICRATAEDCKNLCLALNPDTPISRITPLLATFGQVLVMGVNPGWSGQGFQQIAVEKTRALRNLRPSLRIGVDGGVKPENARALIEAGADVLVAGSALTDQPDPADALLRFKNAVQ